MQHIPSNGRRGRVRRRMAVQDEMITALEA
jgi:hypothetical protein